MKKKIIAGLLAAVMATMAIAHTNSIGYVGDGTGGLNFWYGNWHPNTTFNEAEIKITRPNGTTSINAFSLLSQTTPAGLISGVNYFSSSGTGLVPYGSNSQTSYTWQGINYTGLTAGSYTFTYIPLGDAESTLGSGLSPTANWAPMDNIIRSLTITLTAGDLSGDANQNGILDVLEVPSGGTGTPSTPSAPTVVSQGSSHATAYTAVSNRATQTVYRSQTHTTWDNMSDGTTQNTQSHTHNLNDWVGRVDQLATADRMLSMVNRDLDFNGVNIINSSNKMNNDMRGTVRGLTIGDTRQLDRGWSLGGGLGLLNARVNNNGTANVDSSLINLHGGRKLETATIGLSLTHAANDYTGSRTIGDFSNSSATQGRDSWATATITGNGEKLRPVFGITRGVRKIHGYTESGDVQTARTIATARTGYTYATVGAQATVIKGIDVQALHHTDNVKSLDLVVNREFGDTTVNGKVSRNVSPDGNSNSFTLALIKKF